MTDFIVDVAAGQVKNVISAITSLIKEEVRLLHGLKTEAQNLKINLKDIEDALRKAEYRQFLDERDEQVKKDNESLKGWLGKLKTALLDAEDILETFATEAALSKRKQPVNCFQGLFVQVLDFRYKRDIAHKIKEISDRLNKIQEERITYLDEKDSMDESSQQETSPSNDAMEGRNTYKEQILKWLLSDKEELSVIPIFGMPGIGKSTLARHLFNDGSVEKRFGLRKWVTVSVNFDLTRILKNIIGDHSNLKLSPDLSQNDQLESCLLQMLNDKSLLLVLDDVWNEEYEKWEELLNILKRGVKGSKVIVTTRIKRAAELVTTNLPITELGLLPQDECWSLFEKIAFNRNNNSKRQHLEDIGRQIVCKCKGLPLMVRAMAGALCGRENVDHWRNILRSPAWELDERKDMHHILPVLKKSYIYLPPYLKQCFVCCSIFPKAYVFHQEDLVKFWIAQGFIHSDGDLMKLEETGNEYIDELVTRSFFQRSDIEKGKMTYQMHDLMHDLARSISTPHCHQVTDTNSCTTSQDCRHVSLLCKEVEQSILRIAESSENLRTLLFPIDYLKNFGDRALQQLFHKLKYLRMLDLSNSTLSVLPSSIEELKLLHYLDLSRTEVEVLPNSICNLYNLQTLKLLGCPWFFKLPEDFGNLVNLCDLELDDIFWFKSTTLPPRIGNLTSLRNLHAFQIGLKSGYGIEELKNMAYLTGKLHISKLENAVIAGDAKLDEKNSLDKLVLEWSSRDVNTQDVSLEEKLLEDLQPHSSLTELHILNYMGSNFPNWITSRQLQNLRTLTLNGCTGCRILSLAQIPRLHALNIKRMQKLEKWSDEKCMSLSILKISCCEKLSELPQHFSKVRHMKIKKCCSLKSLPVTPSLWFLILDDNPVLEYLNEQVVQVHMQYSFQKQYSFQSLLEMKIINCPKLQALPKIFSPLKLEISGCELMTTITVPDYSKRLQHLALNECHDGTLVRAIPDTSSMYSLVISNISNLISFTRWPSLPGLKALYISNCKDLASLSGEGSLISFSSLELLSIRGCSKLESLPDEGLPTELTCLIIVSCSNLKSLGTKGTLKNLNSLKDLHIEDCPLLLSFPEDGLPTSLQHLHIQDCPSLSQQCGTEDVQGPEWPKISNIPDQEIDFIRSQHPSKNNSPSAAWYLPFFCCIGFFISDTRQPEQQLDAQSSTAIRGKGNMEREESSTSAQ